MTSLLGDTLECRLTWTDIVCIHNVLHHKTREWEAWKWGPVSWKWISNVFCVECFWSRAFVMMFVAARDFKPCLMNHRFYVRKLIEYIISYKHKRKRKGRSWSFSAYYTCRCLQGFLHLLPTLATCSITMSSVNITVNWLTSSVTLENKTELRADPWCNPIPEADDLLRGHLKVASEGIIIFIEWYWYLLYDYRKTF